MMKNLLNQLIKSKTCNAIAVSVLLVSIAGCGASDHGQVENTVAFPTGTLASLYCDDIGVGEETCVLDDPANPYARSVVVGDAKWDLNDFAPSTLSKFYLWATAHVRDPQGENQFFAADSLHRMFLEDSNALAQEQAKRAYRVVLDDFFGSVTFDVSENSFLLRNWVADRFVSPSNASLPLLYDNQSLALQALDDWGYLYDFNTSTISRKTD